jgi:hypothetical protein
VFKVVGAASVVFLSAAVWIGCRTPSSPPAPEQPLAFSHRIHAGQFNIDCQYCHVYARRGPVAGIPSVQRCAGCHFVIASDRPQVVRLMEYWERREPVPWMRIHRLPAHARFSHQSHVVAGVACATCHGDVAQMEGAAQVTPLMMGWCLTCHDDERAPRDCLTCHH